MQGTVKLHPLEAVIARSESWPIIMFANMGRLLFWTGLIMCCWGIGQAADQPLGPYHVILQ